MDTSVLTWNRPAPALRRGSSNSPFPLPHDRPNCQICDQNRRGDHKTKRPRNHRTTGPRRRSAGFSLQQATEPPRQTLAQSVIKNVCTLRPAPGGKTPRISRMTRIHRAVALVLTKYSQPPSCDLFVRSSKVLSFNTIRVIRVIRGQSAASFQLKPALRGCDRPSCGLGSRSPWSCGLWSCSPWSYRPLGKHSIHYFFIFR